VLNNQIILPTSYFGPIPYYSILVKSDDYVLEKYENFIKQTVRSRCIINSSSGKLNLSIPRIRKNSSKTKIKDIRICYNEPWQKIHLRSIITCYNSSPFFDYYKEKISKIFDVKEKFLIDFSLKSHLLVMDFLKLNQNINYTKVFEIINNSTDYRNYDFFSKKDYKYDQVYFTKNDFIKDLSVLDLIFNLGPESIDFLKKIDNNQVS
jgi:hypothetical protein